MRLDLGGEPFPSTALSRESIAGFDEHLEECTHLRIRRAGLTSVNMPAGAGPSRNQIPHRLAKVQTLELDYNEIEKVDGEHFAFPELEVLDLSYNHIVQITNAPAFLPRLRVLILKKNKLKNLRWLRCNTRVPLAHLDFTGNQLTTLSDCAELVNLELMDTLDLTGNPLETDLTLEAFCMMACEKLVHLNGQVVTETARSRAKKWCEESDAGFQVKEYVSELQSYYKKHATPKPANQRKLVQTPDAEDDGATTGGGTTARKKMTDTRAVRDPNGYLKHAKIALKQLTEAARVRGYVSIEMPLMSTMSLREFDGPSGERSKMLSWRRWSQEMKRYARRINEAQERVELGR
jgi:hypothetical protein